jgi:hypothetical protein
MPLTDTMPPSRRLDADLLWQAARDAVRAGAAPAFDAWRVAYANAVAIGLAPRSMLASRDVESAVDAMERWALGPFARGVRM